MKIKTVSWKYYYNFNEYNRVQGHLAIANMIYRQVNHGWKFEDKFENITTMISKNTEIIIKHHTQGIWDTFQFDSLYRPRNFRRWFTNNRYIQIDVRSGFHCDGVMINATQIRFWWY